jgi:hypothetical protein
MASSTEGWAAIIAAATTMATLLGQLFTAIQPIMTDYKVFVPVAVIGFGAGIYIWFRRRQRLQEDHV